MDLARFPLKPVFDFGGAEVRCLTLEWLTYISVDVHECGINSTRCNTTGALDDMMAALMPRYGGVVLHSVAYMYNMFPTLSRYNFTYMVDEQFDGSWGMVPKEGELGY